MKCKHLAENCTCTLQPIQADCPYPDKSCSDVSTRPNPVPRFIYDDMKAQREMLLYELRNMLHLFDRGLPNGSIGDYACKSARAAIAKCEAIK